MQRMHFSRLHSSTGTNQTLNETHGWKRETQWSPSPISSVRNTHEHTRPLPTYQESFDHVPCGNRRVFGLKAFQMGTSVWVSTMFVCVRARSCVGGLLEQGIFCVGEERGLGTSSSLLCTAKKGRGQKSGRLENSALHADRSGFKGGGGSWIALKG